MCIPLLRLTHPLPTLDEGSSRNGSRILATSETLFRAGAATTVDLVVGAETIATPSEYELLEDQVR
jgi:hypothetical protein